MNIMSVRPFILRLTKSTHPVSTLSLSLSLPDGWRPHFPNKVNCTTRIEELCLRTYESLEEEGNVIAIPTPPRNRAPRLYRPNILNPPGHRSTWVPRFRTPDASPSSLRTKKNDNEPEYLFKYAVVVIPM